MSKLVWDQSGEKLYETGVEQVALYVAPNGDAAKVENSEYAAGVAWNGVSAFNINPSGAEPTALYANNRKLYYSRCVEMEHTVVHILEDQHVLARILD